MCSVQKVEKAGVGNLYRALFLNFHVLPDFLGSQVGQICSYKTLKVQFENGV